MNDGIENHNSATLCYIIATIIIVWLAASFLNQSYHQLAATHSLQKNLATEHTVMNSIKSLSFERRSFDKLLNTQGKPETAAYKQLNDSRLATETSLDALEQQLDAMRKSSTYTSQIMYDEAALTRAISKLRILRRQLNTFAKFAHAQLGVAAIDERISYISANLHNRYTNLTKHLIEVGSGSQFNYPESGARIGPYKQLLRLVWDLEENVSYSQSLIDRAITKGKALDANNKNLLRNTSRNIERDWKLIDQKVHSKGVSSELMSKLQEARTLYNGQFFKARSTVISNQLATSPDPARIEQWNEVNDQLNELRKSFIAALYTELEDCIDKVASRASAMLLLNTLLIIIAVGIVLFAVAQHRKFRHFALHDTLTGLPNRAHLRLKLQSAAHIQNPSCAMIFVDLNRFKAINDKFGLTIGDELLLAVAKRLQSTCDSSDFIARLRGDEFVIFIENAGSSDYAMKLTRKVIEAVSDQFSLTGGNVTITASAGVSYYPADCNTPMGLLNNTDIALNHSKSNNSAPIQQYNQQMGMRYHTQLQTEQDLGQALGNNEFELYYQPKVDTYTGMVRGVEALIRWNHPEKGLIPPFEFIPIAEDTGLITQIGKWALSTACREIASFNKKNDKQLSVAVNISAQQFSEGNFLRHVTTALSTSNLPVHCLELEITESIVLVDIESVIEELEALKELGISIAIDDFGTGYSSLQYLQRLPLDTLKIDRSFIMAMESVDPKKSVANSIVQMGKLFNLTTVAEGVETENQKNKIHSLGVDLIQGYLYAKPVQFEELGSTIADIEHDSGQKQEIQKTA